MLPAGFEPTISACKRPQTYALDREAIGTRKRLIIQGNKRIPTVKQTARRLTLLQSALSLGPRI